MRRRSFAMGLAVVAGVMPLVPAAAETAAPAARVIALGGSVTEIVVALGAADRLVARDSTSTWPDAVNALPDVGYLRALSPEGVLALRPDLIIAEADAGPPEAVAVLKSAGVPFVTVTGRADAIGVLAKIEAVAQALGLADRGADLAADVNLGFATARDRAEAVGPRKKVLFVLSLQGGRVMAAGQDTAAEGILHLAGAENAAQGFSGYRQMTDEAVMTAAPDAVLMMDRGGDHSATAGQLFALPALAGSPAAARDALIRMDGLLLLGFGPRTPEAANTLRMALYGQ